MFGTLDGGDRCLERGGLTIQISVIAVQKIKTFYSPLRL